MKRVMRMTIIGLSGKRGVGKTTFAKHLVKFYGFKRVPFGQEVKSIAKELFPFNDLDFLAKRKERLFVRYDWTPRQFLIALGEMMRYFDEDYWVNKVTRRIRANKKGRYIIDDLRYLNEARRLTDMGAVLIRVNRYAKDNPFGKDLHIASEMALDNYEDFKYTVDEFNNTTMHDLAQQADIIMKSEGLNLVTATA